ncbi:3-methyl-2-oxobutanoate hydroxymethyltransferase [Oenococcus alcoholitolerans]|uniref:3-methyl-2-oxobutanoate hydroxymethyltransferase n=1 Tax=Oenococcus alcoholitolerans TaxID=931074 RepID=A0ABR4XS70_9LACO|nr:3-methyl-2-oxobutanoate hydroxymethyltransferase [Oenococcus alcoholitolerans]
MKNTVQTFQKFKDDKKKISMLTAYDYSTAALIEKAGINAILVGDSLGMVVLGHKDTLSVTVEDMIYHSRAVTAAVENTMVVVDLPFMSYQVSAAQAVKNAGRLVKEGHAQTVKLEGGRQVADRIEAITAAGIPVMGHLGLTPQSVNAFGGFKVQGKTLSAAEKLIDDALAVQKAGAFALVLECVPDQLAALITEKLSIPTIGIGAGAATDGQILVYQDMLGIFSDFKAKFVKRYDEIGQRMLADFKKYDSEVKEQIFPSQEHTFKSDPAVMDQLIKRMEK